MYKFILTIDSACDYDLVELKKENIPVIFYKYSCDDKFYDDDMLESSYKSFYKKMRGGKVFKTSQINPQEYYDFFEEQYKLYNLPIIHISLGSGVSNTINSANIAISMLKDEYSDIDVRVIDSKLASAGLAILLFEGIKYRNEYKNIDETYDHIMELVPNLNTYYTTNTLTYFAKGGRLSKVEAFIGNALKINPILDCSPSGALRVVEKQRGSEKAYRRIIERIKATVINPEKQTVIVCDADNKELGQKMANRLKKEVGFKDYKLTSMGPIIGAHTGPDLIAIFYLGKPRNEQTKLVETKEKVHLEIDRKIKKYS